MRYDLSVGYRREVVNDASAGHGTGIELTDGRILYVYISGDEIRRGWVASAADLIAADHSLTTYDALQTGFSGSVSVSMVDGRILMLAIHYPAVAATGTAFCAGAAYGLTCYESTDDGENWTALGTASGIGFGNLDSGLGDIFEMGTITMVGTSYLVVANEGQNYFGASSPSPAVYRSTDDGASWTITRTDLGGAYANTPSRTLAIDQSGAVWSAFNDNVVGSSFYYDIYSSSDDGATWTYASTLTQPNETEKLAIAFDGAQAWTYHRSGTVISTLYLTDADFGTETYVADKVYTSSYFPPGPFVLVPYGLNGTLAFSGRYVDVPATSTGKILAPLRIPWPRWSVDAGLDIPATIREQEHQNYLAIDRWWTSTRAGFTSILHVPYKRWAVSAGLVGGGQEEENYYALERWAGEWNRSTTAVKRMTIPHRRWAERDPLIPRQWIDREQENYLAMERSVNAST